MGIGVRAIAQDLGWEDIFEDVEQCAGRVDVHLGGE